MAGPFGEPAPEQPGAGAPSGAVLAGLWLGVLERLAALAAHEVNNALNGAVVNVEVLRVRARPGADAGAMSRFAEAAAGELESAGARTGALLALARPGRAGGQGEDLGAVVRHVAAIVGPAVARDGVTVHVGGPASLPLELQARVVRLAVGAIFLTAVDAVRASGAAADPAARTDGLGGANPAQPGLAEPAAPVVVEAVIGAGGGEPLLRVEPRRGGTVDPAVVAALGTAGVVIGYHGDAITLSAQPLG